MNELPSTNDDGGQEIVVHPDHRLPKALLTLAILLAWVGGGFALFDEFFARGVHGISILGVFAYLDVAWSDRCPRAFTVVDHFWNSTGADPERGLDSHP
jgi:hypothetical protein